MDYQIGDKVITTGLSIFNKKVPIGSIGTIIKIRERYPGTSNAYKQYKLEVLGHITNRNNLDNMYTDYNIKKLVN